MSDRLEAHSCALGLELAKRLLGPRKGPRATRGGGLVDIPE